MKIKYAGTDIHFRVKGTGNPMILLHGFLESSKIWKPFLPALQKKRQVVCIDLPGHGRSGYISNVHTMELMADVVKVVLEHLKIEKAGFVGHSMGGYVCLALLGKSPLLFKNLVLVNSTPEADSEERKQNRERAIDLIRRNKSAYINMAISNLTSPENSRIYRAELDKLKKEAQDFSAEGITASLKGMKIRTNKAEVLNSLNKQKILILGKEDPVLDVESNIRIGIYCGCKIILTENGHLSYLENFSKIQEILLLSY